MKYNKNKVLTVLTSDQANVGDVGWVGNTPVAIMNRMAEGKQEVITALSTNGSTNSPFTTKTGNYALFYPFSEPEYRPYEGAEIRELVGEVVKSITDPSYRFLILCPYYKDHCEVGVLFATEREGGTKMTREELLDRCIHLDGSRCGVEVGEDV